MNKAEKHHIGLRHNQLRVCDMDLAGLPRTLSHADICAPELAQHILAGTTNGWAWVKISGRLETTYYMLTGNPVHVDMMPACKQSHHVR